MRLFLLTALTMTAFATNSILTRMAVDGGHATATGFAVMRVAAGAAMLFLLVSLQGRKLGFTGWHRYAGAVALTVYMVGFSVAYRTLGAGLGALILFGTVQIAMFASAAIKGQRPKRNELLGSVIALGGLTVILWPPEADPSAVINSTGAAMMVAAGLGWAQYTILGRCERDPLAATTANFMLALPITALALLALGERLATNSTGAGLAIVSGAVASGLGYALWYSLQPKLGAIRAALVQLSVPVIAIAIGWLLLSEGLSVLQATGTVLVLAGIALTSRKR